MRGHGGEGYGMGIDIMVMIGVMIFNLFLIFGVVSGAHGAA